MMNAEKYFMDRYHTDERIVSMMVLYNDDQKYPQLSGYDVLVLIVTNHEPAFGSIYHYIEDGRYVQERWVSEKELKNSMFDSEHRYIIRWLIAGDILIDRTGYMQSLRETLMTFDQDLREQKLLKEFSMFLATCTRSKEYLRQNYLLDAHSQILSALHHWARITVIEAGTHPEVIVWQQVYTINPGVYKLYEELLHSEESLEQRVRLLVLACEFAIMSKMKESCKLLFRILESRDGAWSAAELYEHPLIRGLNIDLSLVLRKLVAKSLLKEVKVARDGNGDWAELKYCLT